MILQKILSGVKQKLYCYVDETGQDTMGELFIVSVVITKEDRDKIIEILENIEQKSGKKFTKWHRTAQDEKEKYLKEVFQQVILKGKIFYTAYRDKTSYKELTVLTIASAITTAKTSSNYKASVFIDGLQRSDVPIVGSQLRHIGIRTEKIRGLRDESNALIRLADAIAGFIRENLQGDVYTKEIYLLGRKKKVIHSLP